MKKFRNFVKDFMFALSMVFIVWIMLSIFDVFKNQFDYETINRYADWNFFEIALNFVEKIKA